MISWLIKKVIGSKNQRLLKGLRPLVAQINEFEKEYQTLSLDALREKVAGWKAELAKIEDEFAVRDFLDRILPEAFAAVKNAARRLCGQSFMVCDQPYTWNMVHFDVQLLGGVCLHRGMIAEMATGEGKTLVATLPLFLNALAGRGAHLVTTNDYLARRDGETMGQVYALLGLQTGVIQHDQDPSVRRAQYYADITYGMNSEFGFDYLRDNGMASTKAQQVQRPHFYAIVDEVDSILIDEARTPLIISGPATISTHQFDKYKPLVDQIVKKQATLCARLTSDAEEAWEKGDQETFGKSMCKVKWGQPRNKGLLRAMEDPDKRRVIDKTDLSFYSEQNKEEKFRLQDDLFFTIDERSHEADLTEQGRLYMSPDDPDAFVLPDLISQFADIDNDRELNDEQKAEEKTKRQALMDTGAERIHNISQLLRAYCLYEKDVNYVVEEGKVVIVDEFTGRKMTGRRWSEGLHGAVEAKEGVTVERETQTLATITIQNYFRLYSRLAGMTGTAETEANEFHDVYKLDVSVIPTNRPCIRKDMNDFIYKTRREKFNAVVKEIAAAHAQGQPVLVGTVSVEASEVLSRMLKREKIPHSVLNAKYHMQEAEIIARAGQKSGPPTFSVDDLVDIPSLAGKLDEPADAVSTYIENQLSDATRKALTNYCSSAFTMSDLVDPLLLASKLDEPTDPVSAYLKEQFSDPTRAALKNYGFSTFTVDDVIDPSDWNLFSSADLIDPSGLAEKLRKNLDPVSQFLSNKFSEHARRVLNDPAATVEQHQCELVKELNKILRGKLIYSDERFKGINLSPQTILRLTPQNSRDEDLAQLNRLLLEAAYPLELGRIYPSLAVKLRSAPVSQFIWSQFSDQARQVLTKQTSTSGEIETTLVQELNNVLTAESIHSEKRFRWISLSPQTLSTLMEEKTPSAIKNDAVLPQTPSTSMEEQKLGAIKNDAVLPQTPSTVTEERKPEGKKVEPLNRLCLIVANFFRRLAKFFHIGRGFREDLARINRLLLIEVYPRKLDGIRKDSTSFSGSDFIDSSSLIGELGSAPVSQFVWNQFSDQARQVLIDPASTSEQKRTALLEELNKVLTAEPIYSAERFKWINLAPQICTLMKAQKLDGQNLARINRLLLIEAYPRELRRSRPDPEPLQTALVDELNKIIDGQSIYDEQRFSGVVLRPETRQLLTQNPKGKALALLNRLLLDDVYPHEFANSSNYHGSKAVPSALQTSLIEDLNKIIRGQSIFDAQRFAGVPLRPEIQELLAQNPQGEALVRLNRLLLEVAYPREIARCEKGQVTISTNMAGRGTDIKLGAGVPEVGGLMVIGTERHESRRIDRQLRGRCARQGDPGLSRFYVSFEDDLMRNFGSADRMTKIMERFGLEEGQELEHPWLNKSVETAQKRVEQRNYMIRKRSLDFDDVMNKQREVIYGWRNEAIGTDDPRPMLYETIDEAIPEKVISFLPPDDDRNSQGLVNWINTTFPLGVTAEAIGADTKNADEVGNALIEKVKKSYELKCGHENAEAVIHIERYIILNAIDRLWQEHLYAMDSLREAVYLRAYGQKDPLIEYKNEAYEMFTELMGNIKGEILHNLFRSTSNLMAFEQFLANLPMNLLAAEADGDHSTQTQAQPAPQNSQDAELRLPIQRGVPKKVGRNDPCPCGSGKKFKNCCGRTA